eukprot:gene29061-9514_t
MRHALTQGTPTEAFAAHWAPATNVSDDGGGESKGSGPRVKGVVKMWITEKGFGFIKIKVNGELQDAFTHASELRDDVFGLVSGQEVTCALRPSKRDPTKVEAWDVEAGPLPHGARFGGVLVRWLMKEGKSGKGSSIRGHQRGMCGEELCAVGSRVEFATELNCANGKTSAVDVKVRQGAIGEFNPPPREGTRDGDWLRQKGAGATACTQKQQQLRQGDRPQRTPVTLAQPAPAPAPGDGAGRPQPDGYPRKGERWGWAAQQDGSAPTRRPPTPAAGSRNGQDGEQDEVFGEQRADRIGNHARVVVPGLDTLAEKVSSPCSPSVVYDDGPLLDAPSSGTPGGSGNPPAPRGGSASYSLLSHPKARQSETHSCPRNRAARLHPQSVARDGAGVCAPGGGPGATALLEGRAAAPRGVGGNASSRPPPRMRAYPERRSVAWATRRRWRSRGNTTSAEGAAAAGRRPPARASHSEEQKAPQGGSSGGRWRPT